MAGLYQEEILGEKQKAELARKLRENALVNLPQGQMISGWYTPPSWTQGLANALQIYKSRMDEEEATQKAADLSKQRDIATIQAMNQAGIQAPESLALQAGTPEQSPGFLSRASAFLRGEDQPQAIPAKAYQQNVAQNITPDQKEAGLMNLLQVNPDVATGAISLYNAATNRALTKSEKEYQHAKDIQEQDWKQKTYEETRADRLAREAADRDLRASIAGNRQAPQVYGVESINGVPMRVNKATGQVEPLDIPSMPKLDVTTEKAILESDELANSSRNVIGMLETAKDLNKKAYSGVGAGLRANIVSNLGGSDAANATVDLDNIMAGQALESLKSTFGGNPTEGERKILIDLQASSSKTPAQRESIINRAIAAAERRAKFHSEKSSALREGTYFSQGMPEQQTSQPSGWAIRPKGQ